MVKKNVMCIYLEDTNDYLYVYIKDKKFTFTDDVNVAYDFVYKNRLDDICTYISHVLSTLRELKKLDLAEVSVLKVLYTDNIFSFANTILDAESKHNKILNVIPTEIWYDDKINNYKYADINVKTN